MASVSYHETLTILIASVMAVCVAAAQQECSNLNSVEDFCNATSFPDLCYDSLVPKNGSSIRTQPPQEIYNQSAELALSEVSKVLLEFAVNGTLEQLIVARTSDNRLALRAMESCRVLFSLALDNIHTCLSSSDVTTPENRASLRTWMGAAEADLQTCQDGFDGLSYEIRDLVTETQKNSTEYVINSIDIICAIDRCANSTMDGNKNLSIKGRKLLQAARPKTVNSDVVMAKGGSGN
ncbi:hypothetical protein Salat_2741900 [Sesamum alatum]|uniref:Pectinesterase inhibitor domain-containing protein n=1 Tax=Sesamum alatum TaxID=300844 RepID=A0AAE1XKV2_9LAMI|nr:hypothetical protein Salat_2741900 [Sesamum alatum]